MSSSWRDLSRILAVIIALGLIVYNLYLGTEILESLFRGVVAYLVFNILNILLTTILWRVISDYEFRRLEELNRLEDAQSLAGDEEDTMAQSMMGGTTE